MDDIWDNWDTNFDYDSEMDGQWNRQAEMEICLKTYDGTQHLRLHGWLKRNDTLIKMEISNSQYRKRKKHYDDWPFRLRENRCYV